MSIYLQGVCSSLPFYLSKHIWYPVAGASNRNVCFPEDACSLFIQFCALVVWICRIRPKKKRPLVTKKGEIFLTTPVRVCDAVIFPLCVSVTMTQTMQAPHKRTSEPSKFMAAIPLVLQTERTPVEATWATPLHLFKYAFTLTSNVTANPQGGIDFSDPYGSKGYIFMWH